MIYIPNEESMKEYPKSVVSYYETGSYDLLNRKIQMERLKFLLCGEYKELMDGSALYNKELFTSLDMELNEEDMGKLDKLQKTIYAKKKSA